jgi:hypothetical protein
MKTYKVDGIISDFPIDYKFCFTQNNKNMNQDFDIIIVGGGALIFTAINIVEKNPKLRFRTRS